MRSKKQSKIFYLDYLRRVPLTFRSQKMEKHLFVNWAKRQLASGVSIFSLFRQLHTHEYAELIDPQLISKTFVSPRIRAQKTFELLFENSDIKPAKEIDERVREWTYGDYEGLFLHEIEKLRRERGLASEDGWDIWMQGCVEGRQASPPVAKTRFLDAKGVKVSLT